MPQISDAVSDSILWDVVEEHFDEAAFLFAHWQRALHSPKYSLKELREIERRLDAHLDGLVVGGHEVSRRRLEPALSNADEPEKAAAAALALLAAGDDRAPNDILDAALNGSSKLAGVLMRALALANAPAIDEMLLRRLRVAASDSSRAALLESLTFRGTDPEELVFGFAASADHRLLAALIDAAARFGQRDVLPFVETHLQPNDPLRAAALRASMILGSRRAWELCRNWARAAGPHADDALLIVAMLGEAEDKEIVHERLGQGQGADYLIWLLGFCGSVQAVDRCMDHLAGDNPTCAKAAAESIAWITGLNLHDLQYRISPPEPAESETLPPLEQDDPDADLSLKPLDEIPPPNAVAIAQWWGENRTRFAPGQRYLLGRPFSRDAVARALEIGSSWRRHDLALEIAIRTNGRHTISTEAFSSRQRKQIARLSEDLSLPGNW